MGIRGPSVAADTLIEAPSVSGVKARKERVEERREGRSERDEASMCSIALQWL